MVVGAVCAEPISTGAIPKKVAQKPVATNLSAVELIVSILPYATELRMISPKLSSESMIYGGKDSYFRVGKRHGGSRTAKRQPTARKQSGPSVFVELSSFLSIREADVYWLHPGSR